MVLSEHLEKLSRVFSFHPYQRIKKKISHNQSPCAAVVEQLLCVLPSLIASKGYVIYHNLQQGWLDYSFTFLTQSHHFSSENPPILIVSSSMRQQDLTVVRFFKFAYSKNVAFNIVNSVMSMPYRDVALFTDAALQWSQDVKTLDHFRQPPFHQ